jgi:hypothetical protein
MLVHQRVYQISQEGDQSRKGIHSRCSHRQSWSRRQGIIEMSHHQEVSGIDLGRAAVANGDPI